MLRINLSEISEIENATQFSDLFPFLQKAIELEHSTVPPYLTALFSIKSGQNRDIYRTLYSVVLEEMLHFTIACNILNAIGGSPQIYSRDFVPKYPTTLPMNINNSLIVSLEKFSQEQLLNVFMEIEEPEKPLVFPINVTFKHFEAQPMYATIGMFYAALKNKINELNIDVLPGDPNFQVTSNRYSNTELFPILKSEDALKAIDIIVEQGEGTTTKPIDQLNHIAHYYRFKEINIGRKLIEDTSTIEGYSYSGDDIEFEEDGIYPFSSNTKIEQITIGTVAREKAELFAKTYTKLLKELHTTFNGKPNNLPASFQTMRELTTISEALAQMPFPDQPSLVIGPTFEFLE